MEREEPNDVRLATARGDQWLLSGERRKDLLNEKKLRPHALRPIPHEPDESAGRNVGRDQCLPNGDTNGVRAARRLTRNVGVTLAVYRNGRCGTVAHFTSKM